MVRTSDPVTLRFADRSASENYKLLVSTVIPRPIAWVSTVDKRGGANLAPFSFFNVFSIDPPILGFSTLRPELDHPQQAKDTLLNIRETGECVIHIVPFELAEVMNRTAARLPYGEDELAASGLKTTASEIVRAPRISAAPVAFECRLERILDWGDKPMAGNLILMEPLIAHLAAGVSNGRCALLGALDPIGRLGGAGYVRAREAAFELERPA